MIKARGSSEGLARIYHTAWRHFALSKCVLLFYFLYLSNTFYFMFCFPILYCFALLIPFFTWFFLTVLLFLFFQSQVGLYSSNWGVGLTTEESGFDIRRDQNTPLLLTAYKHVIGTAQLPTKVVQVASSPEKKRPGREGDYTSPSNAEVKNEWISTLTPSYIYIFVVSCIIEQMASTCDLLSPFLVFCSTLLLFI